MNSASVNREQPEQSEQPQVSREPARRGGTARKPGRIYIIGAGGVGKTSLADRLGRLLGAPVFSLDEMCYIGGKGGIDAHYRPYEGRVGDVHRIAGMERWVAEGIYLGWTGELLRAADTIIWLDLPWRVAAWRIIVRHIRRSLRGRNPYPGVWRLLAFVLWTGRYYLYKGRPLPIPGYEEVATRADTKGELAQYADKVVWVRHPHDVSRLVERISRGTRARADLSSEKESRK